MTMDNFKDIFSPHTLEKVFPVDRTDQFFEALFGDATEGSYDISLAFKEYNQKKLRFEFHLKRRPGKCLACHLTSGLPEVFARHPVINIKGIVKEIDQMLNGQARSTGWQLGTTQKISDKLHVIPLTIFL